jgi:CBS domain containing-hemolysin-like protein
VQAHELAELLEQSQQQGVLAAEEGEAIRRVTRLGARRVKEVMTPRVFLAWIRTDATRREIAAEAQRTRRRRLVVAEPDLDSVSGFLDVRSYLLDARGDRTPLKDHIQPAGFIPELATIGQLLGWFERSGQRVAVVVDEFGGTAGMVTLRDAVGEIGGREADAPSEAWVRQVGGGWTAPGDADLGEAFERLGEPEPASGADTVAGAIMERLDRVARVGDEVQWGGWRVRVLAMSGTRIDRVQWMPAGEGQGGA